MNYRNGLTMDNYEQLCRDFVSKQKSVLIAPAGYGKTYTIAECLKYTDRTQLILTHTHAGVASLKTKIKDKGFSNSKYHIETIASFAQKYVESFYCGDDVPEQDNSKEYFPFIIEKAICMVKLKPIKDVVRASYAGLFVDEYQDCTINQHQFVMALANILPIHILGDPLQGIFDFGDVDIVNWESDLKDFTDFHFELTEPWRWKGTNQQLGDSLKKIREKLENGDAINLNDYNSAIEVIEINDDDIFQPNENYYKEIRNLLGEGSVLIIHPDSGSINVRIKIVKTFNRLYIVEATDGKEFYNLSKAFDDCDSKTIYNKIHKVIYKIFNKTELNKWFNADKLKNKRSENDKKIITPVRECLDGLSKEVSYIRIAETLKQIKELPYIICYRKELFSNLCKAIEQAEYQNISAYESMKQIRNVKRRMGRTIKGKCIGTTLLTKGLEFDTVAVLNAHKFKCPKNLYVALTRASKRLLIFTNNTTLNPY